MGLSRQNQQLLFTLVFCAVLAVFIGYLFEKGAGNLGQKEQLMEIADDLAQCTTRAEYLALLSRHYPPDSPIWQAPAMKNAASTATAPARLEQLRDGRLMVSVAALTTDQLLEPESYVYVPAILVDDSSRGYRLDDVRINSRQTDIVFEYYFQNPDGARIGPERPFRFLMGRRRWDLQVAPPSGPR